MNVNLLNIINRIVAEQGEGILADAKRLFPFFADYAKNEYKEERVAFGRCIEYGAYQELKKTGSADERQRLKATLADQINAKTGVDRPRCADALDLLEAVIFKTVQQSTQSRAKLCSKCGKELQKEWTSCPYCSTPVAKKVCSKCGKELQKEWTSCPYCSTSAVKAEMQTSRQPQNAEMPKNIKKLLLAAMIIALVYWFLILASQLLSSVQFNVYDPEVYFTFGLLLFLVIATVFTVLGQKKNNRKKILAAGILYLIACLPSAVLCFIAFAKMKKINKEQ